MKNPNTSVTSESYSQELLLTSLLEAKKGNFNIRLPLKWSGIEGEIAIAFNDLLETNHNFSKEIKRVSQVVGKEGKLKQRIKMSNPNGNWGEMFESVNSLIDDLVQPTNRK